MPRGPQGPQGPQGEKGLSAYDVWKLGVLNGEVSWNKEQISVADFFQFLKGKDGKDGKDGLTPKISIGENNHWYINGDDTGVVAIGKDGKDGLTPTVIINDKNHWVINGEDTGVLAKGLNAYELWKEYISSGNVEMPHEPGQKWPADQNTQVDFWKFLTGATGETGQTPHIGKNGNWFIGSEDLGIKARGDKGEKGDTGAKGADAQPPKVEIDANGHWLINGTDTGISAAGKTPTITISGNGNWIVDGKDTGKKAVGADGQSPEVAIGKNGNWYINRQDTHKPAYGKDGKDGKSAYELWVEEVKTGNLDNPHKQGEKWPKDKIDTADFWEFLSGKEGQKGADGKPGEPGKPGAVVTIVKGVPNVIAQYSIAEYGEYVSPVSGNVVYKVYDKDGKIAPGAVVKGMPGVDPQKTYTADKKGEFTVPKEDLPEEADLLKHWGVVKSVTIKGEEATASAKNTYVPNRVHIRMVYRPDRTTCSIDYEQDVYLVFQRKCGPDQEWEYIPTYLDNPRAIKAFLTDKNNPKNIGEKIYSHYGTSLSTTSLTIDKKKIETLTIRVSIPRFVVENLFGLKNSQDNYWKEETYITLKDCKPFYGEETLWNGVCNLPRYQVAPTIKELNVKTLNNVDSFHFFNSVSGKFDFSNIDMRYICKSASQVKRESDGMEKIDPVYYSEEEAKRKNIAYVKFLVTAGGNEQGADSKGNKSSYNHPEFSLRTVYLGSAITVYPFNPSISNDASFLQYSGFKLTGDINKKEFSVVPIKSGAVQ